MVTEKPYIRLAAGARGHGIGLYGIRQMAEKYSGYFKASAEGDVFCLEVALCGFFDV